MGIPTKEELYQWYVVEDHPYKNAGKHFDISQWYFDKLCREYGIKKDRHKTCLKSVKTREAKAGGKEAYKKQLEATREKNYTAKYGSVEAYYKHKGARNKEVWNKRHQEILDKIYTTKSLNKSFNKSSVEDLYYVQLCRKYSEEDVVRQYIDERYPFRCDFYIKSQDLFIELNIHWTHGGHRFDPNNFEDLSTLERWKKEAETSQFYANAIKVWTDYDVKKYTYAIKNNLNYITIYDWRSIVDE